MPELRRETFCGLAASKSNDGGADRQSPVLFFVRAAGPTAWQAGQFEAADRLRPVSTASTVRVRNGNVVVTDGPFAETREQLGGYYQIEAKNLDEALAVAARIPSSRRGSIEVRPIWPAEDY